MKLHSIWSTLYMLLFSKGGWPQNETRCTLKSTVKCARFAAIACTPDGCVSKEVKELLQSVVCSKGDDDDGDAKVPPGPLSEAHALDPRRWPYPWPQLLNAQCIRSLARAKNGLSEEMSWTEQRLGLVTRFLLMQGAKLVAAAPEASESAASKDVEIGRSKVATTQPRVKLSVLRFFVTLVASSLFFIALCVCYDFCVQRFMLPHIVHRFDLTSGFSSAYLSLCGPLCAPQVLVANILNMVIHANVAWASFAAACYKTLVLVIESFFVGYILNLNLTFTTTRCLATFLGVVASSRVVLALIDCVMLNAAETMSTTRFAQTALLFFLANLSSVLTMCFMINTLFPELKSRFLACRHVYRESKALYRSYALLLLRRICINMLLVAIVLCMSYLCNFMPEISSIQIIPMVIIAMRSGTRGAGLSVALLWLGTSIMAFAGLYTQQVIKNQYILAIAITLLCLIVGSGVEQRNLISERLRLHQESLAKIVEMRTEQLQETSQKNARLLSNVLPDAVIKEYHANGTCKTDLYENVTILFADIVGFTAMAGSMEPVQLAKLLNAWFTICDTISETHGLEKIKTIGDAYLAAAGVPLRRQDHCIAVANAALDMLDAMRMFSRAMPQLRGIRIGISTGSVVAGIIGFKKFCFDIWGPAVNKASRLESNCMPGRVLVCSDTRQLLSETHEFDREDRDIDLKGIGPTKCHFLVGRKASPKQQAQLDKVVTAALSTARISVHIANAQTDVHVVPRMSMSRIEPEIPATPMSA